MSVLKYLSIASLLFFCVVNVAQSQEEGRIVFTDPKNAGDKMLSEADLQPRQNAWGGDLMIGNDGFGLGVFYTMIFAEDWTSFVNLSFTEVKDSRQQEYYDYWGSVYTPNKVNRIFRIPLLVGVQYRLFSDEIVDNFRPYLNGGVGPVMLYITSAKREFFTSLGYGHTKYAFGGYTGIGAQFGFDQSSVLGLNIRYYIIPIPKGIQSVEQGELANANGFFITLNFGIAF